MVRFAFDRFQVMFSAPANFTDKVKEQFMNMLIKQFGVLGVNIVNQALLALYSYNSMSGIVVDIGERLEIVPVTDGRPLLLSRIFLIISPVFIKASFTLLYQADIWCFACCLPAYR